jgi:hypothetical protein
MNILLSKPAQSLIKRRRDGRSIPLQQIVLALEALDITKIESSPNVRKISRAEGEIYVFRHRGLRVFFTRSDNDLVILSILNS